jgi:ribosome biogenesis GTPase / thiamine phosphate phosphatase
MARRRLTQQQRARIAKIQAQRREKAAARAEASLGDNDSDAQLPGRVVVRHGQNLIVRDAQQRSVHCLFRQNLGEVVCGDGVLWQPTENDNGVVTALLPRDSTLSRPDYSGRDKPIAANITQLVVVLAPRPEPSGYLLDQYLVAAERIGVRALICLGKADLLDAEQNREFLQRFAHYPPLGYPLVQISAKTEKGLDPLLERLRDHTSILVGQSGVGKSSLINAILPSEEIEEGRLSDATGLGRHTTSAATLYHLPSGGEIIDSPGVRSFRLGKLERRELEAGYPELRERIGQCRFNDCSHTDEPGCAVQRALREGAIHPDRLASFLHLAAQTGA